MDTVVDSPTHDFIAGAEVWGLKDGPHSGFAEGEGLPGNLWIEARPVVLNEFGGTHFRRADAARAGDLAAVTLPIHRRDELTFVVARYL